MIYGAPTVILHRHTLPSTTHVLGDKLLDIIDQLVRVELDEVGFASFVLETRISRNEKALQDPNSPYHACEKDLNIVNKYGNQLGSECCAGLVLAVADDSERSSVHLHRCVRPAGERMQSRYYWWRWRAGYVVYDDPLDASHKRSCAQA